MPQTSKKKNIPVHLLVQMAEVLKLLAHPQRLRIIELLEDHEAVPVHEIVRLTRLPQPVVSQHLNDMKRAGLVHSTRKGKEMWYRIGDPRSISILDCIRKNKDLC